MTEETPHIKTVTIEPAKRGMARMPLEKRIEIAKKGGQAISRNRGHMSEIGKKGAIARWAKKNDTL